MFRYEKGSDTKKMVTRKFSQYINSKIKNGIYVNFDSLEKMLYYGQNSMKDITLTVVNSVNKQNVKDWLEWVRSQLILIKEKQVKKIFLSLHYEDVFDKFDKAYDRRNFLIANYEENGNNCLVIRFPNVNLFKTELQSIINRFKYKVRVKEFQKDMIIIRFSKNSQNLNLYRKIYELNWKTLFNEVRGEFKKNHRKDMDEISYLSEK